MDPLSDVLRQVKLTGAVFLGAKFTAPWSVLTRPAPSKCTASGDQRKVVNYHLILEGGCIALLPGMEPVQVEAGDLILFPQGDAHVLSSAAGIETIPTDELLGPAGLDGVHRLEHGGGGKPTRMVCGFLTCDVTLCKLLLGALPRMMKISTGEGQGMSWIESSLRFSLQESVGSRSGSSIVVAKLAELLFVEAIRRFIEDFPDGRPGWLASLRDPHVGRALALMHEKPAHPWTVDELGRRVALSRSALGTRFAELLGQPPMAYLTTWRMQLAARMLSSADRSIARIAEETGYESEPSFHRAFKREFGVPPAMYRRQAASDEVARN